MSNNESILDLMVAHHALIEILLDVCEASFQKNQKVAGESLTKLRWEMDKHIFVEEKAIFSCSCSREKENRAMVARLVADHARMLSMLTKLDECFISKKKVDFLEFHKLMLEHRNFEETSLYPKIDSTLDREQRMGIIKRINEISLKS